jgi:bacterioferritin
MAKKSAENLTTINLLNQILQLEYSLIVHYPRLASAIRDEAVRKLAVGLGNASVDHANVVAKAITKLGGKPVWAFGEFPRGKNTSEIFKTQLEKEKQALRLHLQSAGLVTDTSLKDDFHKLAKEEETHIKTVENILAMLEKTSD